MILKCDFEILRSAIILNYTYKDERKRKTDRRNIPKADTHHYVDLILTKKTFMSYFSIR